MHEKSFSVFESQEWQDFFEQAARRDQGPDAHFWWRFFAANCFLQGILKDARILFSNTTVDSIEYLSRSLNILKWARNMLRVLLTLDEEYQHFCPPPQTKHPYSTCLLPVATSLRTAPGFATSSIIQSCSSAVFEPVFPSVKMIAPRVKRRHRDMQSRPCIWRRGQGP